MTKDDDNQAQEQARAKLDTIEKMIDAYHEARESDDGLADYEGEKLTSGQITERIQESALHIQVREPWHTPGETVKPIEYSILLCTGGPAVHIIGELGEYSQPETARLEYQDWGTPWTEYMSQVNRHERTEKLIEFARFFWFGD